MKRGFLIGMIVLSLVLAGVVSYWASSNPDGLEHVAEQQHFDDQAQDHPIWSLAPDYEVDWVESPFARVAISGVIGVLLMLVVGWGVGRVLRKPEQT